MGLCALALYLPTRPAVGYNSDVYTYVLAVEEGRPDRLFHEHHLLYNATGAAWTRGLHRLGIDAPTDSLLRALSALFGSLTVAAFYALCRRVGLGARDRALVTFGFASCFAIWMFSVDVEVYVPSTLFLVLSALALVRAAGRGSASWTAAAGALMAVGALYHQMGALFAVPAAVVLARGGPWEVRIRRLAVFYGAAAAIVLPAYVAAGVAWHGVRSPSDLLGWALGYALRGYGAGWRLATVPDFLLGHGRSLVFFEFVLRGLQREAPGAAWGVALVLVAAGGVAVGVVAAVRGWRRSGPVPLLVPVMAWYATYALFAVWWEPENPEFWVTAMAPFWILWGGGQTLAGGRGTGLLAGLVALAFTCNLTDLLRRRDPRSDPTVAAALAIHARVGGSDVVLLPPTVDAAAAFFAPGLQRISVYQACRADREAAAALASLQEQIERAFAEGRRVFLYERAFSREVLDPHPWCAQTERSLRSRYRRGEAFGVSLPVDEDAGERRRRIARWRTVPVVELLPAISAARPTR